MPACAATTLPVLARRDALATRHAAAALREGEGLRRSDRGGHASTRHPSIYAAEAPGVGPPYTMWNGVAVTAIVVERTPELVRLQQKVADAWSRHSRPAAARRRRSLARRQGLTLSPTSKRSCRRPAAAAYFPHVTVGTATEAFVKRMKGEPFDAFTFSPTSVAIYQLGNFGTASKKLWQQ